MPKTTRRIRVKRSRGSVAGKPGVETTIEVESEDDDTSTQVLADHVEAEANRLFETLEARIADPAPDGRILVDSEVFAEMSKFILDAGAIDPEEMRPGDLVAWKRDANAIQRAMAGKQ